jgi:putative aldouronate transport system permease protein
MVKKLRFGDSDSVFDAANWILLTVVLAIVAYPLLFVLSASFSDPIAVLQGKVRLWPKGFTINSYLRVFGNSDILSGYRNTILYTLVGTCLNVVLTIAGAYPLSRKDLVGRNALMLLFTFTMFFSGGLIPSYLLIKNLGMINSFWVMVVPGAVSMYNLIIARTYFQNNIPLELQESAVLDGCSNMGILTKIVLPLSMPIIAVVTLFYGVAHWNAFFNALIYLTDQGKYPLQLVLRSIIVQNEVSGMMETASESLADQQMLGETIKYAVIVVASLPVLLLYPYLQRYFVRGIMVGALKG